MSPVPIIYNLSTIILCMYINTYNLIGSNNIIYIYITHIRHTPMWGIGTYVYKDNTEKLVAINTRVWQYNNFLSSSSYSPPHNPSRTFISTPLPPPSLPPPPTHPRVRSILSVHCIYSYILYIYRYIPAHWSKEFPDRLPADICAYIYY